MSIRALIVDDDPASRRAIGRALSEGGLRLAHLAEAGSGLEALDALARDHFDFVLVDLVMPGMTGRDLVLRMRAEESLSRIPVVVISGAGAEARAGFPPSRALGCIDKPFSATLLAETIMDMLSRSFDVGPGGEGGERTEEREAGRNS